VNGSHAEGDEKPQGTSPLKLSPERERVGFSRVSREQGLRHAFLCFFDGKDANAVATSPRRETYE
jgi:hypothetical protein